MFIANFARFLAGGIATFAIALSVNAQNFVPNPSFETQTGCPTSPGVFTIVGNWYVVPSHSGSPDYFHVCGNSTFGVPTNVFGSQLARTGSAYIGFVTHFGSGNFREYLEVLLTSPLTSGVSYRATAYLTLSDGSGWATDGFGFYFSGAQVTGSGASTPLPLVPQVANTTNNFINDKINWQQVTGTFVATAGLQYMTIGNFKADALTNVQVQASGWAWNYTYLDDISVTPTVILTADMSALQGDIVDRQASLYWETFSEQGTAAFAVERSVGDLLHFETIGEVAAMGGSQTNAQYAYLDPGFDPAAIHYYRLREVDQNGEGGYSNTIELRGSEFVNQLGLDVFPNPVQSGDELFVNMRSTQDADANLQVFDLNGKQIWQSTESMVNGDNVVRLDLPVLAAGCYVVRAQSGSLMASSRFLVEN